ncbi:MAG: class I SAM-dependent methyltransferase [Planctomycetota bacterium]
MNLRDMVGGIDIYLLDQVLRGNVAPDAKVLDVGCGGGRNLTYFVQQGHEVFGVDQDPEAISHVSGRVHELGGTADDLHFRVEPAESLSFGADQFDLVICNAVLHFSRDLDHLVAIAKELTRVVRPNGIVFTRLCSSIGIEPFLRPMTPIPGWHQLPDGSDRFLVDLTTLLEVSEQIGAVLVDPIKTVNVQNRRCMTNWVWRPFPS